MPAKKTTASKTGTKTIKTTTKNKATARAEKASSLSPEDKIEQGFSELFERELNKRSNCFDHNHKCKTSNHSHCGGALYGFGFIGALVYYIMNATGFWMGVLGVLKALVWPAFLVFELLKLVGA
jgi:hypothetical protein